MFILSVCFTLVNLVNPVNHVIPSVAEGPVPSPDPRLEALWRAICQVESGGNAFGVNRREDAIGIAQIRRMYVDDCNRIVGYKRWSYTDRYCPQKSREMFDCYVRYYAPKGTLQDWARIHNGGPNGARKSATLGYWQKIRRELARLTGHGRSGQ
jgi:hypothetical protein